jgi:hypothetical protein
MSRTRLRPVLERLEDRLAPAVFNVNSLADILNPPRGVVTLRSALAAANRTAGSNIINLAVPGTYQVSLAGGSFDIMPNPASPAGSTLTIRNTSGGKVVVAGNHLDRVFDINANQWFGGALNGGMEVPFNTSTGVGSGTIYYNADTSAITFNGNFFGLTSAPTTVELNISPQGGGANGPVATDANGNPIVFTNVPAAVSGAIPSQTFTVTPQFVSQLEEGDVYENVLTSSFPNGEIRGQLTSTVPFGVVMSGFTIEDGAASAGDGPAGSGGGIRDQGNVSLTLNNMVIANNMASADGGGVAMVNVGDHATWTLAVTGSTITGNYAGAAGGGIETDGPGTVVIQSCTIRDNVATDQGGGIWLDAVGQAGASLTMTGSIVKNNRAVGGQGFGGGIGNSGNGAVRMIGTTIVNNFAGASGGGFDDQLGLGTLTIQSSRILDNFAVGNGGGIYEGGPLTSITGSTIAGNRTGGLGGGILAEGITLHILSTNIARNVAGGSGGGIELETTGTGGQASSIDASMITGNTALSGFGAEGGGVHVSFSFIGDAILRNDTITANAARDGGGVFWAGIGNLAIEHCAITRNTAPLAPNVSANEAFLAAPTGAFAQPPTSSPASGFIVLLFNSSFNAITIYGTAQLLTGALTAATVEVNGSVATDVNGNPIDYTAREGGVYDATFPAQPFLVTPAFASALLAGNVTTTLDTTAFPTGEIRGQFMPQPGTLTR